MQVHVARAELGTLPVDAIVNPTSSLGIMGGGVSGTLRRMGGDVIQQEAMAAAPIAVGAAIITSPGSLPCRFVIHAPTMEDPGIKVIAFAGMGTDLGDVPMDEAARAIVEEIRAHKRACPETIYLVDTNQEMVEAFEDALRNAVQNL
jgi:O-acetyl-ADP-ribose deacetylase (regulator of RNase III)